VNSLEFNNSKIIIPNLLSITLVKNKGAAFSLFSDSILILTIISISTSLLLILFIFKYPTKSYWNATGLAFLLGGTIGNGLDRIFKGYVIDFINLLPINFPIFNIADISINIAILYFIIDIIKKNHQSKFNKLKK
tara:strand:+ start:230 stop:634 length:405 start_codon:yes stop_codon:yes gene_type:complete